ncbi:MAG: hypothetical protein CVU05_03445 [Bacteroidetes bacterium HGW-Bacteroidetes-21]|jgi:hypothetical protein|nr:MAG: hypothetical protein CVU05_03445 [Bacteroidetes bacterium HGW-Bacteroidetes-21]
MKFKYYFLILTLLFTNIFSFSQSDSTDRKTMFVLKTDIVIPFIALIEKGRIASLTLEYGFNNHFSVQLTGLYSKSSTNTYQKILEKYIIEDFKFFTQKSKSPFSGFYIGVYSDQIFDYAYGNPTPSEFIEYKTTQLSIGPVVGYQNHFHKKLVFDFIFGIGRSFEIDRKIIRDEGVNLVIIPFPIDIRLAFNFGYRF